MTSRQHARNHRLLIGLGALLAIAAIGLFVRMWQSQPQLDADEEVFNTVDALFTALTSRDAGRLDDCERRLEGYRDDERLAATAADVLDTVIRQARAGEWEAAAKRLYEFMLAQRGE